MQPALVVDRFAAGGLVAVVAGEDGLAAQQDLAVGRQLQLDTGGGRSHRAQPHGTHGVERALGGGLGQAVPLVDGHPDGPEPLEHGGRDGRRSRDGQAHAPQAELVAQATEEEQPPEQRGRRPASTAPPPGEGAPGAGAPTAHPEAVVGALQPGGAGHATLDTAGQPFPDAWHAEEEGGLHLAQALEERLARRREVDGVAAVQGGDDRHDALADVGERQVRQHLVGRRRAEGAGADAGGGHQVGVGEDGALRRPGGAGRVHQHGRVPRVHAGDGRSPVVHRHGAAALLEVVERQHGAAVSADAAGVDDHDVAELLEPVVDGEQLVDLLLVLGDGDHRS